ncbi:MAG: class I SAM-dependent methyltransferase [Candidatus Neomarinimicrobiota bacterium]
MNQPDYYSRVLSGERLRRCYELAPPRVRQYLAAEIEFVLDNIAGAQNVLELGCGYGRVLGHLSTVVDYTLGIDTSHDSLLLARQELAGAPGCGLAEMNVLDLALCNHHFDTVVCIQNGISAFGVDQRQLMAEALRVARPGGKVLFSSYADQFWDDRLEWFRIQAEQGLIGELDLEATGTGVIVCRDGLELRTVGPEAFKTLAASYGIEPRIVEVDRSSLFSVLYVP